MTHQPTPQRPTGIPEHSYLVLTQADGDYDMPVVLGVFASFDDLKDVAADYLFYASYDPDEDDLAIDPIFGSHAETSDMNVYATGELVIVDSDGGRTPTALFVWDSAKKREAYKPLKLYWCTTPDGDEDWFMIAHTAQEAAVGHAYLEGYDVTEPAAEFVMNLPEKYQAMGDDVLGCPEDEVLLACGAKFLRYASPRVVEVTGRTFTEGMLEGDVCQARGARGSVVAN
jgi:hypothetical protein